MEEADQLCTRIGIMNFGKLRCLGTQTRLKARFGLLTFNCAPGHVEEVKNFVQINIPMAVHVETYAGRFIIIYCLCVYLQCMEWYRVILLSNQDKGSSSYLYTKNETMAPLHVATLTAKRELPKYEIIFSI